MTMTKKESMVLSFATIRRMASGTETPAGVSLIEANLMESDMTAGILTSLCPLSDGEAEYIMACVAAAGCEADDWDSIPVHARVDYSACEAADDAWRVAFSQLIYDACVRVANAIEQGDD